MAAYYNEFDKKAAQWLRNLISAGLIAPGDVDDRSIADVSPDDLRGYTQCHFFAGIGIWSYALRRAGWSDDEPVWTMSCPCQPFSAAGATAGFADERHLWPFAAWLIEQRQPPKVFGEQVAGKIVDPWVDLVHADLERMGYAFGAVPFPAASVRAPHVRDRLYWVGERLAHAGSERLEGGIHRRPDTQWQIEHGSVGRVRAADGVANAHGLVSGQGSAIDSRSDQGGDAQPRAGSGSGGSAGGLANPERDGRLWWEDDEESAGQDQAIGGEDTGLPQPGGAAGEVVYGRRASEAGGFWDSADWLFCQDGKWRPVEPGTLPLAHGVTTRVVELRAYGNAINAEQATVFIEAYQEAKAGPLHLERDECI